MSADHEFQDGVVPGYCAFVLTSAGLPCGQTRSEHPPAQVVEADDECACGKLRSAHHGGTGRAYDITGNKFCGGFSPAPPTDPARRLATIDARTWLLTNGLYGWAGEQGVELLSRFAVAHRQAGADAMREACAKWADTRPTYRCEDCGHEGRVVERSSCCGDQCPKCGGSPERIVVDGALVRALPIPEPRS